MEKTQALLQSPRIYIKGFLEDNSQIKGLGASLTAECIEVAVLELDVPFSVNQ